jgi:hypothetical protein
VAGPAARRALVTLTALSAGGLSAKGQRIDEM